MQLRSTIVNSIIERNNKYLRFLLTQINHADFRERDIELQKSLIQYAIDADNNEALVMLHEKDQEGLMGVTHPILMINEPHPVTFFTPLHDIVNSCSKNLTQAGMWLRELYRLGADFTVQDNHGRNAIAIARDAGNEHLIELLIELGCPSNLSSANDSSIVNSDTRPQGNASSPESSILGKRKSKGKEKEKEVEYDELTPTPSQTKDNEPNRKQKTIILDDLNQDDQSDSDEDTSRYTEIPDTKRDRIWIYQHKGKQVCALQEIKINSSNSQLDDLLLEISQRTNEKIDLLLLRQCDIEITQFIITLLQVFELTKIKMFDCRIDNTKLLELADLIKKENKEIQLNISYQSIDVATADQLFTLKTDKFEVTLTKCDISVSPLETHYDEISLTSMSLSAPFLEGSGLSTTDKSYEHKNKKKLLTEKLMHIATLIGKGHQIVGHEDSLFLEIHLNLLANLDNVEAVAACLLANNVLYYDRNSDDFISTQNGSDRLSTWLNLNNVGSSAISASMADNNDQEIEVVTTSDSQASSSSQTQGIIASNYNAVGFLAAPHLASLRSDLGSSSNDKNEEHSSSNSPS